ncbi:pentapeptide repeat-containing protein [Dickeya sp. NCPPB 3274]|uniref:pentapeptide repeat-containing protein n=1 Tax=Dickeya sp. NCPPB 3274 TaxID=568766 RepID=UPI0008FBF67A|nr:pentapeptide repeat-containing protein [Dickeya sp. NCPPB 3274]
MTGKLKKELRNRWPDELNFEINRNLKKEDWRDKGVSNSRWRAQPFGLTDEGKVDFRGFSFREPIHYHLIKDIDFSYSQSISGNKDAYGPSRGITGFIDSVFDGCKFVGSTLPANLSEHFNNCDFSGSVFESTRISADFNLCIFVSCKMKDILIRGKKFVGCDFSKANLSKSNFYSCYFEDCIFDDAKFTGCNISGSTFVNTRLSEAQITSCSVADKLKFL